MRTTITAAVLLAWTPSAGGAPPVQRLSFERELPADKVVVLDVSTIRGKIDVATGDAGRISIRGTVTVRVGWNVPADAVEIARRVAAAPPIEQRDGTIRLRPPAEADAERAVTISYQVEVPRSLEVRSASESGATSVRGVAGAVAVRTQSGAIELRDLGGAASVTTGSGAVTVNGVASALDVTTSSSAFIGRSLGGDVRVRTTSGAVDATLSGAGDVDVETGSSAIHVRGSRGTLTTASQSGRISVDGAPAGPWTISTGSGSVDLTIATSDFDVDAATGSGSIRVQNASVQGQTTQRAIRGAVGSGGPLVSVRSRSGSIDIARDVHRR